jgi:hypothetical protein
VPVVPLGLIVPDAAGVPGVVLGTVEGTVVPGTAPVAPVVVPVVPVVPVAPEVPAEPVLLTMEPPAVPPAPEVCATAAEPASRTPIAATLRNFARIIAFIQHYGFMNARRRAMFRRPRMGMYWNRQNALSSLLEFVDNAVARRGEPLLLTWDSYGGGFMKSWLLGSAMAFAFALPAATAFAASVSFRTIVPGSAAAGNAARMKATVSP